MAKKEKKKIVITNKFKDESDVNVKNALERAFKMFYKVQVSTNKIYK